MITNHNEHVFSITNILDTEICKDCIEVAEEQSLFPINKKEVPKDLQKSFSNRLFITSKELSEVIWKNIYDFVPKEYNCWRVSGINENFRFYKYLTGQEFTMHQDADFHKTEFEKSYYSLLIYLNDNFKGGETKFENLTVKPVHGSALIFPHVLFHSGSIVTSGTKYILRSDVLYKKHR
ncbi:MAG: 2OG-Fe(II) oxygenase [Ferruginibacter sp.]